MKFSFSILALVSTQACLLALGGCAVAPDASASASNSEETEVATDGEALTASADRGYYIARQDTRRCASPMCGGLWVRAVNQKTTLCADGKRAAECYVADISTSRIQLSSREDYEFKSSFGASKALVRAAMTRVQIDGRSLGRLNASEAWLGASGSLPDGTFFRAADNGVRCITTPCPTTGLRSLNVGESYNALAVGVAQTVSKADEQKQDKALQLVATKGGLLFAGSVQMPKCMVGARNCGPRGVAAEFYLPVQHTEGVMCGTRGGDTCGEGQYCAWAAGDLCGAADAPGRCSYRPQMCPAIYQPVCGCDGVTYGNLCEAGESAMGVLHNGECK